MSVLEQMKQMLSPLGIYSLNDSSLIMCELKVYATQLEKLHENLNTLLKECFIRTAEDYGIEKLEELFGNSRPDLTKDERKALISRYTTLNNTDFSQQSIKGQLKLSGACDNFTQDCKNEQISFPELIALSDIVEVARQLNILEDIVPAHLSIDVGITARSWDEWDSLDLIFGNLDRMNLRFDLFD